MLNSVLQFNDTSYSQDLGTAKPNIEKSPVLQKRASLTIKSSKAKVYFKRKGIGPKLVNSIVYVKNLLQLKGIQDDEVQEVILEDDEEVQAHQLLDSFGDSKTKKEFPLIHVMGTPIGTISDLEEWVISHKIDTLLEGVNPDESQSTSIEKRLQSATEQKQLLQVEVLKAQQQSKKEVVMELQNSIIQLDRDINTLVTILEVKESGKPSSTQCIDPKRVNQLGYINYALETIKGVSSSLSSVASYFSWGSSTEGSKKSATKELKDERGASYFEFEVIQINWYWRQQKRILRFSTDKFFRLNPFTRELRAVHKYMTFSKLVITGKTFLTIYFDDESQPEYYQTIDLESILQVLKLRFKELGLDIPVSYVNES